MKLIIYVLAVLKTKYMQCLVQIDLINIILQFFKTKKYEVDRRSF